MTPPLRRSSVFASPFLRAVATLTGGNVLATILPILAAPVLGRLYAPADYGFLAVYMAIAGVIAVVGTMQYQMAIIAEPTEHRAGKLVYLTIALGAVVALPVALGAVIAWATFFDTPAYREARSWILMLPITVLMGGLVAGVETFANRHRRYRSLAVVRVTQVCCSLAVSIVCGFLGWGVHGLFLGYLAGHVAQLVLQARVWLGIAGRPRWPGRLSLWALARRHRNFPRYALPGTFLNTVNLQLPVFALGSLGATETLGQFNRARQLVSTPITLLGWSIASVYRQEGAELFQKTGSCRPLLVRTAATLLALGVVPSLLLVIFAPALFQIYLGDQWRGAGEIARILVPMLLLRMITSPLMTTFQFTGHQRTSFRMSIIAVGLTGGALLSQSVLEPSPTGLIWAYSIAMSLVYVLNFTIAFKVSQS